MPTSWVTISLSALHHNYQQVRRLAPNSLILAMVKANAYGHGLLTIAKALPEADAFGVAHAQEALLLRKAGIHQKILVMTGFHNISELQSLNRLNVDIVLHTLYQLEQLEQLEKQTLVNNFSVWLKIDTGMHRIGFSPVLIPMIIERLNRCKKIQQPIKLLTHFSEADRPNSSKTLEQQELFQRTTREFSGEKSLANSAAILSFPNSHADWVRPGIMLYGISPFATELAIKYNLRPVMTLKSKLIAVNCIEKGETIGYGSTYVCSEKMRVGVVSIGYGDGYPRHARTGTPVLVNGKYCPLIGCVSMDMLSIDLRLAPMAQINDEVTLWGNELPAETIAAEANTIPYDLITKITSRVRYFLKK